MDTHIERPVLNKRTPEGNIAVVDTWIADTSDKLNILIPMLTESGTTMNAALSAVQEDLAARGEDLETRNKDLEAKDEDLDARTAALETRTASLEEKTNTAATASAMGMMSAEDKAKLDGIAEGANKVTVDASLSSTSTNPVQNKAVNAAVTKAYIPYTPMNYQSGSWGITLPHTGRAISNVVGRTATGGWVVRSDLILAIYDVSAASAANYPLASVTGLCDSVKKVLGGSSWTIAGQIVPCPLCEVLSRSTDYHGYGIGVNVLTDGVIQMGRTYTTDGAYGSLAMDCYNTGAYSFSFYFVVNP